MLINFIKYMCKFQKCIFLLSISISYNFCFAQAPSYNDFDTEIIGIETRAKRPGPPLWQVSNGTNVVWIFGIPSPYHIDDLDWDRRSVRNIMAESQVFIPAPEVRQPLNPIRYLQVARAVASAYAVPNEGRLEDTVSPELYERFLQAKTNYWPRNEAVLEYRPLIVGGQLFSRVLSELGLVTSLNKGTRSKISKAVARIARNNRLEIKSMHQVWQVSDFSEIAESRDWNVACLESVLDSIEQDLEGIANRSHAWAEGDVTAYRDYDYPHTELACERNVSEGGFEKEKASLQRAWLEAIDETLIHYESTFSTMNIDDLVRPDGLLEQLLDRGYSVRIL